MIASFFDKDFNPIQDNNTLIVDDDGYKLVKRPIELNELNFTCEAFDADINPTFLVLSDKRKRYVYGCLAGVPTLTKDNKAEIYGTDLKSILSSDIFLNLSQIEIDPGFVDVVQYDIGYFFMLWDTQVNQGVFDCELWTTDDYLIYKTGDDHVNGALRVDDRVSVTDLTLFDLNTGEGYQTGVYNTLEEIQKFLRFYNLYLETQIDIVNRKIKFIIGHTMATEYQLNFDPQNIKLWQYGIKNYGKITNDVNECQGLVVISEDKAADATHPEPYTVEHWYGTYNNISSTKWILLSNGDITTNPALRDIFPIKRQIVTSNDNMIEANRLALEILLDAKFNEDIELTATKIKPKFETLFNVYTKKGGELYKQLPCGELQYDATGLVKFKIGYRYTGVNFI